MIRPRNVSWCLVLVFWTCQRAWTFWFGVLKKVRRDVEEVELVKWIQGVLACLSLISAIGGVNKDSCRLQYKYVTPYEHLSQTTRAFWLKLVSNDKNLRLFSILELREGRLSLH